MESAIEDIVIANKRVLFMFDELPLMVSHFLHNQECGAKVSMEFLDTLREIRNKYEATKKITFIFCGSIGIHLVIKDLKRNFGYNSDPINNMKIVALSGMNKSGAMLLCEKLTEGENYQIPDKDKIFDHICRKTDNIPFYIQHVFAFILESKKRKITEKLIDEAIIHLLNDPKDEGFFNHYIDRIKTYYDHESQKIALFILDKISKKFGFLHEDDIINLVKTYREIEDETVKETINLLWSDHYLIRKTNIRSYKFKYTILKEWWKINRG